MFLHTHIGISSRLFKASLEKQRARILASYLHRITFGPVPPRPPPQKILGYATAKKPVKTLLSMPFLRPRHGDSASLVRQAMARRNAVGPKKRQGLYYKNSRCVQFGGDEE